MGGHVRNACPGGSRASLNTLFKNAFFLFWPEDSFPPLPESYVIFRAAQKFQFRVILDLLAEKRPKALNHPLAGAFLFQMTVQR